MTKTREISRTFQNFSDKVTHLVMHAILSGKEYTTFITANDGKTRKSTCVELITLRLYNTKCREFRELLSCKQHIFSFNSIESVFNFCWLLFENITDVIMWSHQKFTVIIMQSTSACLTSCHF